MESMIICYDCGRTVNSQFVYCPWCGSMMKSHETVLDNEDEDILYQEAAFIGENISDIKFCRLEYSLDKLEKDLSRFISGRGE